MTQDLLFKFIKSSWLELFNSIPEFIDIIEKINSIQPRNYLNETNVDYDKLKVIPQGLNSPFEPVRENIFRAFFFNEINDVKVCILGEEPYPDTKYVGRADGLCFSFGNSQPPCESLRNIFVELNESKIANGKQRTETDLTDWAKKGVLLLNATLFFENGANNDKSITTKNIKMFKPLIEKVIKELDKHSCLFVLWGNNAKKYEKYINNKENVYISGHPSQMSVNQKKFHFKHTQHVNGNVFDWIYEKKGIILV